LKKRKAETPKPRTPRPIRMKAGQLGEVLDELPFSLSSMGGYGVEVVKNSAASPRTGRVVSGKGVGVGIFTVGRGELEGVGLGVEVDAGLDVEVGLGVEVGAGGEVGLGV